MIPPIPVYFDIIIHNVKLIVKQFKIYNLTVMEYDETIIKQNRFVKEIICKEETTLKRVLILGDSISMGYRELVKELLNGEAEVFFHEENGRFSGFTLWQANQWVYNNGSPDVVHWNNGIWDIGIEPPLDGNFAPINEYLDHLRRTVELFRQAGNTKIIFAATTYQKPKSKKTCQEDVERYNTMAQALMQTMGVEINDLGAITKAHLEEYICEDYVHLTEAGACACAEQVSNAIRKHLQ